jgi:hypothetical protein
MSFEALARPRGLRLVVTAPRQSSNLCVQHEFLNWSPGMGVEQSSGLENLRGPLIR